MANSAAIVDALRSVRGTDDTLSRLKSESLEARRDRIAEALAKSDWAGGPADLVATYPHHALANKNGVLMRVKVTESEGKLSFEKPEVFQLPMPVADAAAEVMETAKVAADKILDGKFEEATPMVATIANALHTSGDLHRKITTEIAKRSIGRDAWWHTVVGEHMEKLGQKVERYQPDNPATTEQLAQAVDTLQASLIETATSAALSMKQMAERKDVPEAITSAARDIAADLKYGIQALAGVRRDDPAEMQGVYEGVGAVTGQLRLGAQFLATLAGPSGSAENKETK